MVNTFIDRIRVLPIVGQPRALLITDSGALNQHENTSRGIKRQVPPPSTLCNDYLKSTRRMSAPDAKRRRQRDELNYTASTIQQALEKAGRPLSTRRVRALPSTVDTEKCKVITSAEYDASVQVAEQPIKANINDAHDAQAAKEGGADDMFVYAELIQATRQFYGSVDIQAPVSPDETTDSNGQDDEDDEDDEEELRGSSDATSSTWSPTPSRNQGNLNDKKYIDNDNRSDGASSNPQSSEEDLSDASFSDYLPSPPSPIYICG